LSVFSIKPSPVFLGFRKQKERKQMETTSDRQQTFIRIIRKPNGQACSISEYVRSWKQLIIMPQTAEVANWNWYPVTAAEIINDIRQGVHERINRHLPWFNVQNRYNPDNKPHSRRIHERINRNFERGLIRCNCRWCGHALVQYERHESRFCDAGCLNSFYA
jgi:hypothetical protein